MGIIANNDFTSMFKNIEIEQDDFNYVKQKDILSNPAKTSINGVFVAGTSAGPMDIPDSILSAGAASAETTSYLKNYKNE